MSTKLFTTALVLMISASLANGQIGLIDGSTVDLDTATSGNGHLGVVEVGGRIFVSARGLGATTTPPHSIYEFDCSGALIGTYEQSAAASAGSAWGYRDGCLNPNTGTIYFGYEGGVEEIDPSALVAPGGPGAIAPLSTFTNATVGTFRAMAFDPTGDGGAGSIWTADFGGPLEEVSATALGTAGAAGQLLNSFPNGGWSAYGLAYDSSTGNLWVNSAPANGPLAEIDPNTGVLTGVTIPRASGNVLEGGLSPLSTGSPCTPAYLGANGGIALVGLDQATPDSYSIYVTGDGALLQTGVDGGPQDRAITPVFGGGVLDWNLVSTPAGAANVTGQPVSTFVNITAPGGSAPSATLPGVPGFQLELASFTAPASSPANSSVLLEDGLGLSALPGLVDFDVSAALAGDTTIDDPVMGSTVLPVNLPAGTFVYSQAVWIDGANTAVATNVAGWEFRDPVDVIVEAVGANSFNSDTTSGFFRVQNVGGVDIQSVEFDWASSSQPGKEFDTDQTGMSDIFEGGDNLGGVAGCNGTYRNMSDINLGLVYGGSNTVPASPCNPNANTGWIGSNPVGTTAGDFATLQFDFTSFNTAGQVFEVDIDTDGSGGTSGDGMAGMVVTITTSTGTLMGTLAVDPNTGNRSFVSL